MGKMIKILNAYYQYYFNLVVIQGYSCADRKFIVIEVAFAKTKYMAQIMRFYIYKTMKSNL